MLLGQGRPTAPEGSLRFQLRHRRLSLYAILTFAAVAGLLSWTPKFKDRSRSLIGSSNHGFSIAPCTDVSELNIKGAAVAAEDPTWKLLKDWKFATGRDMQDQRTCLTFDERYKPYFDRDTSHIVTPPTAGTRVAFLQRVRPDRLHTDPQSEKERQQAFALANRALIAELQSVGIDVYFLMNYPRDGEPYEEWYKGVLPDYQGRIFSYVQEDWIDRFPTGTFKGEIAYDNQVSLNAFMASNVGSQYQFAWWMEDDVRSTGSWASVMSFLNATLKHPHDMPDLFLTSDYDPYIDQERNKAATGPSCTTFAGKDGLSGSLINLTGFSRKLHDAMMAHYAAGESCQCEIFVATVANQHGLKVHAAQLPSRVDLQAAPNWPESTTWAHWYPHAATIYYDRWQANASVCRPGPELLHKITYGLVY